MTDYIIIILLALQLFASSRYGVRLMDWIVLQSNRFVKAVRRIFK